MRGTFTVFAHGEVGGGKDLFDLGLQRLVERFADRPIIADRGVIDIEGSDDIGLLAPAEEEVGFDRQSGVIIRHDGMTVNHGLADVGFVVILHDLVPGRGHLVRMGGGGITAGLIIDHAQGLVALRTEDIESVYLASGLDRSDALYLDGEITGILQMIDLEAYLGILAVPLEDVTDIALDDDVLGDVFGWQEMLVFLRFHRVIGCHEGFLEFGFVLDNCLDLIGQNGRGMDIIAMELMAIDMLHRVMDEGADGVVLELGLFLIARMEMLDIEVIELLGARDEGI